MTVMIEQKIISRTKQLLLLIFILVILVAAAYYGYKGLLRLNDWMNEVDEKRQRYSRIKWLFISLVSAVDFSPHLRIYYSASSSNIFWMLESPDACHAFFFHKTQIIITRNTFRHVQSFSKWGCFFLQLIWISNFVTIRCSYCIL